MKSFFKNKKRALGGLVLGAMLLAGSSATAQLRSVIQDPKLGALQVLDLSGAQADEQFIQPQQTLKLRIPVGIAHNGQATPAGSAKIKIGLGSRLSVDPSFNPATLSLPDYFTWVSEVSGGQSQLVGTLVAPLPEEFTAINLEVPVKALGEGKSTITANFLVTNHNSTVVLSDENGNNNGAYLPYTVTTKSAPLVVTSIYDVKKEQCAVKINFGSNQETNMQSYEVELSKDGIEYEKFATVNATGLASYTASIELPGVWQAKQLFVRIKAVQTTGRIFYSEARKVDGTCGGDFKAELFPNPSSHASYVTIRLVDGIFTGKYSIVTTDMAGKLVDSRQVTLAGVPSYRYETARLASGKYLLKIMNADGTQSAVLSMEKL